MIHLNVWSALICHDLPLFHSLPGSTIIINNRFPSSLKPYEGSICGSVSFLTWGSLASYHLPPTFVKETILKVKNDSADLSVLFTDTRLSGCGSLRRLCSWPPKLFCTSVETTWCFDMKLDLGTDGWTEASTRGTLGARKLGASKTQIPPQKHSQLKQNRVEINQRGSGQSDLMSRVPWAGLLTSQSKTWNHPKELLCTND